MTWFVERRLEWIKEYVEIFGYLNRGHIMKKFEITAAQASIDLREVQHRWPGLMDYDQSGKRYVRSVNGENDDRDNSQKTAENRLPEEIPITALELARAFDAFSNTPIAGCHRRNGSGSMDGTTVMLEGFAAASKSLRVADAGQQIYVEKLQAVVSTAETVVAETDRLRDDERQSIKYQSLFAAINDMRNALATIENP